MNKIISIVLSAVAGLSTLIGAMFIYLSISKNDKDKYLAFVLSFCSMFMILVSIFDLFKNNLRYINILFLLIIFCFVLLFYFIFNKKLKSRDKLYSVGIFSMISLILHNLPEGILSYTSLTYTPSFGIKLCLIIALHNIPEGLAIAVPIYYSTGKKGKGMLYAFFAALAEPLGSILACLCIKDSPNVLKYIPEINVFVGIIMLFISFSKLIPQAVSYNKKTMIFFGGIIALLLYLCIDIL